MNNIIQRLREEDPECGLRHSIATEAADRIEELEMALRELSHGYDCCSVSQTMRKIARTALEGNSHGNG